MMITIIRKTAAPTRVSFPGLGISQRGMINTLRKETISFSIKRKDYGFRHAGEGFDWVSS